MMESVAQFTHALLDAFRKSTPSSASVTWELGTAPSDPGGASTNAEDRACLRYSGSLEGQLSLEIHGPVLEWLLSDAHAQGNDAAAAAWTELSLRAAQRQTAAAKQVFGDLHVDVDRTALTSEASVLGTLELHRDGERAVITLLADSRLHTALQRHVQHQSLALQSVAPEPAPLGRVMDVPLAVKLRFGQRQLTLRELLELNTGSLVELDQQVEEPVNLMLGDRIIARGEVVIVDGNYGMRVLEVVEHTSSAQVIQHG